MNKTAFAAVVIGGAMVLGGGYMIIRWRVKHSLETQRGDPLGAFVVASAGDGSPSVLVLDDHVATGKTQTTASADRLLALDLSTGVMHATRVFDSGDLTCAPAKAGRMWCASKAAGIELLDPLFQTVARVDDLVASRGKPLRDRYKLDKGDVIVVLPDGRGARVDGATREVTDADPHGITAPTAPDQACHHAHADKLGTGAGYLAFGPGPRFALGVDRAGNRDLPVQLAPDAPVFLANDGEPGFLELHDPAVHVIEHDSELGPSGTPMLSRVDDNARVLWSTPVAVHRCETASIIDDMLVVTSRDKKVRAYAVDLASGAIRWTYSY